MFLSGNIFAQVLLPVEEFNSDILVHGTSAPNNTWFAPQYYTPIAWSASGGCPDGRIGFAGSWNNYWGNFVRLPEVNCTGNDTVIMAFDVSHSYFAANSNDWCRFYMWVDGAYKHNVVSVTINSVDVTHNAGSNGKGFKFTEVRSCAHVEVMFDLTAVVNKSNILFYIVPDCQYNNSNLFYVWFDNVSVIGYSGSTVNINENTNSKEIHVYPTPASDHINVVIDNSIHSGFLMEVYDINGKLVISQEQNSGVFTVNVSKLESGYYHIRCVSKTNQVYKTSFIKL